MISPGMIEEQKQTQGDVPTYLHAHVTTYTHGYSLKHLELIFLKKCASRNVPEPKD